MTKLALSILLWAWRERSFLAGLVEKYRKLPAAGRIEFDGDKAKALILKYEPIVFDLVRSGFSISRAVLTLIARAFTPRKMTREEEEAWFKRASGNGEF